MIAGVGNRSGRQKSSGLAESEIENPLQPKLQGCDADEAQARSLAEGVIIPTLVIRLIGTLEGLKYVSNI